MWPRPLSPAALATLTGLLLGGFSSAARPAQATVPPPVSIGNVNISVDAGISGAAATEVGRALRLALSDELAQVTGVERPKRPLIVSATLTRVSSELSAEGSKASAAISLLLVRADDQVLFAELRGRASVEEASGNLASLRRAALRRALHRAVARLPEALQRADY
jgi:hypothetical protein